MTRQLLHRSLLLFINLLIFTSLSSQTTWPDMGLHKAGKGVFALTHIHLVIAPGQQVDDATLLIRDGKVEAAGNGVTIPKDALVYDMTGKWVYPGFIDASSEMGFKAPDIQPGGNPNSPIYDAYRKTPGAWNMAVRPELKAEDHLQPDPAAVEKMRGLGFTTLHILPNDGIFRGSSLLLQSGSGPLRENILPGFEAQAMSFEKGSSRQAYPSSLMGSIALIRQTFIDAQWYATASGKGAEFNRALQVLSDYIRAKGTFFFRTGDYLSVLRAQKIASEMGLNFVYATAGDEYLYPTAFREYSGRLIIPLNFPSVSDVKDPADAYRVPLSQLRRWEQAPTNPAVLSENGVEFAFTLQGLKDPAQAWKMLRKAIAHGLPADKALAAFTTAPAKMLGQENTLGKLSPGFRADFFVAEAPIFQDMDPVITQVWVNGKPYVHRTTAPYDLRGTYSSSFGTAQGPSFYIKGKFWEPEVQVILGKDSIKAEFKLSHERFSLSYQAPKASLPGAYSINGTINTLGNTWSGTVAQPDGSNLPFAASRITPFAIADTLKPIKPVRRDSIAAVTYPNVGFGFASLPQQGTFLIRNTTVWTNTDKGILQNTDVLLRDGKIAKIGKGLSGGEGVTVIDGTGKHFTPGIIDEHSHIAIAQGVNEGSHSVTAEVSISDVVDCNDINIYRQLSGGVVASQLLHGSANAIGGQSAVIKLRWGMLPEQMKIADAPGRIKFALGENVKQSNWGDFNNIRYPQTRLGVEQVIRDAFQSALDYRASWNAFNKAGGDKSSLIPPRKDLQMETLLGILDGKRLISCHSYQQGEILMLMRLAESFKFRINTFTHVLEGYKIARELAQHGATASTFSDWWAYKYEVIDAIPYNADIMTEKGVSVCINSDDAEMGRRLNQEAAKAVLYGGMKEEDALKMVTLNPARALRVDSHMGAIKEGMDADVVLWSDNPLSIYAQAMDTWVDGRLLFDRSQQGTLLAKINAERARIIQKMLRSGESPDPKTAPPGTPPEYECETLGSDYNFDWQISNH